MVVRHKYNQMTTLHVVHHAMMPVVVWLFLKFVGGATPPSSCSSTSVSTSSCTSTTSCPASVPRSEVSLVEEVHHQHAVGPVRHLVHSCQHTSLHGLQLSQSLRCFSSLPRSILLYSLHQLLHPIFRQEACWREI